MPYCARCRTEFRPAVETCPDCGERLVDEATLEAIERDEDRRRELLRDVEMEAIWQVGGRVEADRLIRALEQDGIPAFVRSFEETAFSAVFVDQKGWGELLVPAERADEALELLEKLDADPGLEEDEGGD